MPFPNTETRLIKRVGDAFTVETRKGLDDKRQLCDYCAREHCGIRRIAQTHAHRAELAIRSCKEFVPVLSFSVLEGLDRPSWNTIRVGAAWADRLERGMRVGIADLKNRRITRFMRVTGIDTGKLQDIAAMHGAQNHAILARNVAPQKVQSEMLRILKNAYGTNVADPERAATAIYLAG